MYSKCGNVYVTGDMSMLPIKELKPSDHIILLKASSDTYYSGTQATNLILKEIRQGILFVFDSLEVHSVYHQNEIWSDDTETEEGHLLETRIEDVGMEETKGNSTYLWIENKNQLIELISDRYNRAVDRTLSITDVNDSSSVDYKRDVVKYSVALRHYTKFDQHFMYDEKNTLVNYLFTPISSHANIVLEVRLSIDPVAHVWEVKYDAWVFTSNGEYTLLMIDALPLINYILSIYDTSDENWTKFKTALAILPKSISDSFDNDYYFSYTKPLNALLSNSGIKQSLIDIFHTPIYSNPLTGYEAYIEKNRLSHVIVLKGKIVQEYYLKGMENADELKKDFMKAQSLVLFYKNSQSGIYPKNGKLYYNQIPLNETVYDMYECNEGIVIYLNDRQYVAGKCDEYYVNGDVLDRDIRNGIVNQVKLARQLTE